ncbi:MAG: FAD-linked oxidase C-terminal domain-containing protein [Candidatus Acidiferrum sp.]
MSKVISFGALFLVDCDGPIAEALSTRILEVSIAAGGSITAEHGVGQDKKKQTKRK